MLILEATRKTCGPEWQRYSPDECRGCWLLHRNLWAKFVVEASRDLNSFCYPLCQVENDTKKIWSSIYNNTIYTLNIDFLKKIILIFHVERHSAYHNECFSSNWVEPAANADSRGAEHLGLSTPPEDEETKHNMPGTDFCGDWNI